MAKDPNRMMVDDLIEAPNPCVIMMVGTPGSGKSVFAEEFGKLLNRPCYSADGMRETLTGDPSNQRVNNKAWEMVHAAAAAQIAKGEGCIVDGTHANKKWRADDVRYYKKMGAASVVAMYVYTSEETALARNSNRERKVPESVIVRMHNAISEDPPTVEEGFDGVMVIDND